MTILTEVGVMSFINHLLDLKLSVGTIKVYKAALANILFFGYGFDFDNRSMHIFMRGVENIGHRPAPVYKWNATAVANFILNATDNSLKFLTQKALFLLLVACGRRINDTLASVRTPHFLKFSPDNQVLIIHYAPGYRFKNDKGDNRPAPIMITRYKEIVRRKGGSANIAEVNEKLCPVKAVENYLYATRQSNSGFLFVNPANIDNKLNANMASNLVEGLVKLADPSAVFSIKNTRDFSSTQGWLFGASCSLLKASCHWSSLLSFTNTYFKSNINIEPRLSSVNQLQ